MLKLKLQLKLKFNFNFDAHAAVQVEVIAQFNSNYCSLQWVNVKQRDIRDS